MTALKRYYTNIVSLAYSSCGYYLAAGSNFGDIAIFRFTHLLEGEPHALLDASQKYPVFKFCAHSRPVFSLVSTKELLISASVGEIKAWEWSDLKRKEAKHVWKHDIPQGEDLVKPEVNAMVLGREGDDILLYAGCGDNKVYCIDVKTAVLKITLEGHSGYIHCLCLGSSSSECISGSEDGSVRFWDARCSGNSVQIIEPYKHEMSNRPFLGKWIGCVAYDSTDDWLVCGGAPNLCLWHVRSMLPSSQMSREHVTFYDVCFHDDVIVSSGSEPYVNHWNFDGSLMVQLKTSSSNIFKLEMSPSATQKVLALSGSSYKIDVCTDFRYKDFVLHFDDEPL